MVFPSLPIYLDPPNWSQQQSNQQEGIDTQNSQIPVPLQPPSPMISTVLGGGGYQSSIRPGSMADRARLAKIHQPDMALKCPRCESTNTKFCYYNNYNLSQPRHFCKTCRRYWTRGGALRNVPVGGGCRRNNKRSKGTTSSARSSKSPMKPDHHHHHHHGRHGSSSASANSSSSGCTNNNDLMGHLQSPPPPPPPPQTQLTFLPNLHPYYSDASPLLSGSTSLHFGATPSSSLLVRNNGNNNTSGVGSDDHAHEFQIGDNNGGSMLSTQWRLPKLQQQTHHQTQQFPNFLTNLEPQVGVFQLDHHHGGENNNGARFIRSNNSKESLMDDDSSVSGIMAHQANMVKMEENSNNNNNQGLVLSKNAVLGNSGNNDIFWSNGSGNAWSEVPSFNSSTSHLL